MTPLAEKQRRQTRVRQTHPTSARLRGGGRDENATQGMERNGPKWGMGEKHGHLFCGVPAIILYAKKMHPQQQPQTQHQKTRAPISVAAASSSAELEVAVLKASSIVLLPQT